MPRRKVPPPPPKRRRRVPPPPPKRRRVAPPPPPRGIGNVIALPVASRTDRRRNAAWQRRHNRLLKGSLAFYCSEILRGPEEYGNQFLLGPHHLEWSESVNKARRILALAARDHGKSHMWCFGYPLWMIDRVAPGKLGYIFSATKDQAQEHLDKIRQEIIGGGEGGGPNPRLQHLLKPDGTLPKDSASKLRFTNGSEIRARGFGSRVRGGHPWWLVGDDMGNDEWIWSETVRSKANDYFSSAIRPMVVPGGQMVIVGTPFHAIDLYYELEQTGVYHVMKHPARQPDGSPLWPARYDEDYLELTRKEIGSSLRWAREYLVQPISDEASLFPNWLFDLPGAKQPYKLGLPAHVWHEKGMTCYMGVDLAMSASAAADFLVCFVMAVDKFGNRYLVDIVRRKGLGFQDQLNLITNVAKRYDCALVFCEANQYQRVVTDEVVRTSDVPIKAFYTSGNRRKSTTAERRGMSKTYVANKNALDQGVPGLRMLLENSKLKIPWAPETRELVQLWIGEMQAFGWADGKLQGVGAHDDTVMALWFCDHACRVGGNMSLTFDDTGEGDDALLFGMGDATTNDEVDFFGIRGEAGSDDWRPKEGIQAGWFGG